MVDQERAGQDGVRFIIPFQSSERRTKTKFLSAQFIAFTKDNLTPLHLLSEVSYFGSVGLKQVLIFYWSFKISSPSALNLDLK